MARYIVIENRSGYIRGGFEAGYPIKAGELSRHLIKLTAHGCVQRAALGTHERGYRVYRIDQPIPMTYNARDWHVIEQVEQCPLIASLVIMEER